MSKENDQTILNLKKKIEEKKSKMEKLSSFAPITNCMLLMDGTMNNLHALKKEDLIHIAAKLSVYHSAAESMDLVKDYNIAGYNIVDWLSDVRNKMLILDRKMEESALKNMEDKLTMLLSNEKKVELELGEIEKLLQ